MQLAQFGITEMKESQYRKPDPNFAVIDVVSFVDCVFRGVRASEVVEASGSILFRNVKIEPAEKGLNLKSLPTWP